MAPVAALLDRRPALVALRRALPRGAWPVFTARSPRDLGNMLRRRRVDVVVIGADVARGATLDLLRRDFAAIPVVLYLPARSDDADLLRHAHRERVAAVAIEGLDEPVLPRLLAGCSLTSRRVRELEPMAASLDLTDELQLRVWSAIVTDAPDGLDTAELAGRFAMRRETLSRRFAAGGAPSLKRAIDAVRLVAAAQLLGNAAYRIDDVARLLGFSSASSLQQTARRTFGVSARGIAALGGSAIVARLHPAGQAWR